MNNDIMCIKRMRTAYDDEEGGGGRGDNDGGGHHRACHRHSCGCHHGDGRSRDGHGCDIKIY